MRDLPRLLSPGPAPRTRVEPNGVHTTNITNTVTVTTTTTTTTTTATTTTTTNNHHNDTNENNSSHNYVNIAIATTVAIKQCNY